ncbi:MAG: hypothetical protein V1844_18705 [Pseudomonadota bacterium]
MAEREHLNNTKEADAERSSEDLRQDIAKEKEAISQTVEQIGERFQEKLDWREYVKDSPYWTIGAAAGLGYLASRMFITRTTPMERIMGTIADEVRGSLGGLRVGAAGPGLVRVTLQVIATKAVASLIKQAISTAVANGGAEPQPQTGCGSAYSPKADTSKTI